MNFVIIILLLILLLVLTEKDSFLITSNDQITNNKIALQELYQWPCTGCSTSTALKPKFKYNLTDNRCIANAYNDYSNLISKLVDIYNYNTEPGLEFQSCNTTNNTMYSTVKGRYIILENTKLFTMASFMIQASTSSVNKITSVVSYTPVGSVDTIVNKDNVMWPTTNYILIDLQNDIDLASIKITHKTQIDSSNFVGTKITIAIDTSELGVIKEVSTKIVNDIGLTKIIYTQSNIKNGSTRSINRAYMWPGCSNCTTSLGLLYKGSNYTLADERCFKLKDYSSIDVLSTTFINALSSITMDQYYLSCSPTIDTRLLVIKLKYAWDASVNNSILNSSGNPVKPGDRVKTWNSLGTTSSTIVTSPNVYEDAEYGLYGNGSKPGVKSGLSNYLVATNVFGENLWNTTIFLVIDLSLTNDSFLLTRFGPPSYNVMCMYLFYSRSDNPKRIGLQTMLPNGPGWSIFGDFGSGRFVLGLRITWNMDTDKKIYFHTINRYNNNAVVIMNDTFTPEISKADALPWNTTAPIAFGGMDHNTNTTGLDIYHEIRFYGGLLSDGDMIKTYKELVTKWNAA